MTRLDSWRAGPITETSGWGGQLRCYVHANPKNKILHTVLVGEMNGLAHAQLLGQAPAGWPGLAAPRAYEAWVQADTYTDEPTPTAAE